MKRQTIKELNSSVSRLGLAVWVLTIGLSVALGSISLLIYGNPSLVGGL